MLPLPLLTALAMCLFAANSIFARLALGTGAMDAASYTSLRLVSGAVMLVALLFWNGEKRVLARGNWSSALALFVYAAAFSFAYLSLDTGTGALILFACVQATMIGWALLQGDRPSALEWLGLVVAFGAFVWLVSPGLAAPDPLGAALMTFSGIAWGIYTLRGRGGTNPMASTAGNFVRCVPMALVLLVPFLATLHVTWFGAAMAVGSGAISSAIGYALWYRALEHLATTRAAIVQLTVPAIAALGGLVFMGEPFTVRLAVACPLILGGVALAVVSKGKRVS